MRISYTITTNSCPSCGHVFSRSNSLWLYIVMVALFPISLPTLLAFNILYDRVFLSPDIPSIGNPIKTCPKCGLQLKSGKIEKENLSKKQLLNHSFKWLFRISYFFGGVAILFLLGFVLGLFDYDNTVLYCLYVSLGSIFIVFIIAAVYRTKLSAIINEEKQTVNQKNNSNLSLSDINPIEIAKITDEIEANKQNKRDAFYQHLLLIVRDFARQNYLDEEYRQTELTIGSHIRSHLRIYEAMVKDFYNKDSDIDRETVNTLEEFSFNIGVYYLFGLDKIFPDIRVGDVLSIIGEYEPEQYNVQESLLNENIDKEKLVQIIKQRVG